MHSRTSLLFLPAILAAMTVTARAQELRPATTLPRSSIRAVVLQFESPDSAYLGTTIARLFAAEIASSMRDMNGATARIARGPDDHPSINEGAVEDIARREGAVIAVWGSYFLDGDSVSVVTHARIIPTPPLTERDFALVYQTAQGELIARLPSRQLNFATIMFSRAELDAVHAASVAGLPVRREASEAGASLGTVRSDQNLHILSRGNGWAQIRIDSASTGWIQVPQSFAKPAERTSGPSLLAAGIAQYAAGDYQGAENSMIAYVNTSGRDQDMFNLATTRLLLGKARIRGMNATTSLPKDETASSDFERAAALLPDNAAPVEHLAVTRLMRYQGSPDATRIEGLKTSEREMITALREDPDSVSVNNLRVFYAVAADKKFLKAEGTDENEYRRALEDQGLILTQVDQFLVIRRFDPTEFGSIRYGFWSPHDDEGFTISGNALEPSLQGKITNVAHHGVDMHVRNRIIDPFISFDVAASAWYSGYTVENITGLTGLNPIVKSDYWALTVPITLGLSVAPPLRAFPVVPHVTAGGGVAIGISTRHPTTADGKKQSLESDAQFASVWYAGVGADVFFLRRLALSAGLKYQSIVFKEFMYTGQKNVSGVRFLLGLTFIP
ncbi:MAG: SH3 domain-containing protein [Ignavibacteria bacterium]|nr:SH3 domain-containing protein [Ignavibacteria bacterium]